MDAQKPSVSLGHLPVNFSRVILVTSGMGVAYYYSDTLLMFVSFALVVISLFYLVTELFFASLTKSPISVYFITTLDLGIIFFYVYSTGMNSFFLGGVIYATALSSLNTEIKQGIYCVWGSLFFHASLLLLIYLQIIPFLNIFHRNEELNIVSLMLGFSLIHFINFLVFTIISHLQTNLMKHQSELVHEKNKLAESYHELDTDLNMARKIQEKLIPNQDYVPNVYSIYYPMMKVGGDFFDFIKFDDPHKIGIFLSDVSGHGVSAAFITTMIKTIILQAGTKLKHPSELLNHMNEVLHNQTNSYFVTAIYGIYDSESRIFEFANAGHNWPLLLNKSSIESLFGESKPPLGVFSKEFLRERGKLYESHRRKIQTKSKIIIFTDGLTEARARSKSGEFFESEEMMSALVQYSDLNGPLFLSTFFEHLVTFRGSRQFEDDICIISLETN